MGTPYAKRIPLDEEGKIMQGVAPAFTSLQTTMGNPAASSVLTFTANTTSIELTTGNMPIALKWGSASVIALAGTANYDHLIPQLSTQRLVIPVQSQGVASIVGRNVQAGLYATAAVIVASSVLTGLTEF